MSWKDVARDMKASAEAEFTNLPSPRFPLYPWLPEYVDSTRWVRKTFTHKERLEDPDVVSRWARDHALYVGLEQRFGYDITLLYVPRGPA